MKNKNTILIAIVVVLLAASGFLLYRVIGNRSLAIIQPTISSEDVNVRNQADRLQIKIQKAISKIDTDGILDDISESPQFTSLSTEAIRPIPIGQTGRSNPFLVVPR